MNYIYRLVLKLLKPDLELDSVPIFFYFGIATFIITYLFVKISKGITEKKRNLDKVNIKLQQVKDYTQTLEEKIRIEDELLTIKRQEIVQLNVHELLSKLHNGTLKCIEVLQAYQAKALTVTRHLNCVTEFIVEAEVWAKELDQKSLKGPLHGLPFSVKDNVSITGYDNTIGISKLLYKPATKDAAMVLALRELGAIPFCKTNVPQTLLSFGCSNPLWGLTKNPKSKDRTPGGSSGGEGCLIGSGGSLFGLGSDIGGSGRVPAAFSGIFSIKPTSNRMSYKGFVKSVKGCSGVDAVPSIIAQDLDTIILISKLLLENSFLEEFDSDVMPIPWREHIVLAKRNLRVGYYEEDGFFPTTPGVKRSVQLVRQNLEKLGHELIPFSPPEVSSVVHSFVNILNADGGRSFRKSLYAEDIDPLVKINFLGIVLPHIVKRIIVPVLNFKSPRIVPLFTGAGGNEVKHSYQLWDELLKKDEYRDKFIKQWRNLNLDLCIGPTFSCPAPLSKDIGRLTAAGSYTLLYNYLNFPVGVIPVTVENEEDQRLLESYSTEDVLCKLVKKTTVGAIGQALSVQVVGLPWNEEMVFNGMKIIQSTLLP